MQHVEAPRAPALAVPPPIAPVNGDAEALYCYVRDRLAAEAPALLRVAIAVPKIELEMKREVLRVDGTSVKGRIAELIREDYFSVRRQAGETHKRILEVGINCTRPAVNQALDDLTEKRFFLRTKDTSSHVFYKAVDGMKVNVIDR